MNREMEKELFEMLETLVADMAEKTTVRNLYPVDGKLLWKADELCRKYHEKQKKK